MRKILVFLMCGTMIVSGCSTVQVGTDTAYENAVRKQSENESAKVMVQQNPVVEHAGQWVLGDVISNDNRLPDFMNEDVFFRQAGKFTLYDLSSFISARVHAKPMIDQSVFYSLGSPAPSLSGSASGGAPPGIPGVPGMPQGMPNGAMGMGGMPVGGGAMGGMSGQPGGAVAVIPSASDLSYKGSLSGFLDYATTQMGVFWEYSHNTIVLFKTKTAVFEIPSIPIQSNMQSSLSSAGSSMGGSTGGMTGGMGGTTGGMMGASPGGTTGSMPGGSMGGATGSSSGASGGGTTTMSTNIAVDYWTKMERTVQSIAGYGATVVADSSFGTISVTGTPNQINRVSKWVDSIKSSLTKQVALEVKVYNVQITTEDNYGFDPVKALYAGSSQLGLTATSVSMPAVVGGASPFNFGATVLSGMANGSNLVVQALSTMGHVSEVFSRSGVTINGQMLALQSANTQSYLQSSGSSMAANVGSTSLLMPGQVVTGFTGSFLPKVVDGQIFVDFNLTISDLVAMTTFTSGSGSSASSIQLPQIVSTTLQQIASLKSGESLVLTGYRDKSAHTINNGTVTPTNYAFGGGVDSSASDNIVVVVITAKLI